MAPALDCPSEVEAPRCGVKTTFGASRSGLPEGGSVAKTSIAAPEIFFARRASASARSSTISPLAQFTKIAFGRLVDVDVVDAAPGAADDFESRPAEEDLFGDLGPTADDQRLVFGDRREEPLPVQIAHVDIVPFPENLDRSPIEAVGDQDLHRVAADAAEE